LATLCDLWTLKEQQPTLTFKLCGEGAFSPEYKKRDQLVKDSSSVYIKTMESTKAVGWNQKQAVQQVKDAYASSEELLQASYDRLLPVIKEKIAEIQRQGSQVMHSDTTQ
jgi:hypothetical protein